MVAFYAEPPEIWHIDEYPSDWMGNVTLHDARRLTVCVCLGLASAKAMLEEQARYRALWIAAHKALAFISGFEDDELQGGIPELLAELREALVVTPPTTDDADREAGDEFVRDGLRFMVDPETGATGCLGPTRD